MTITICGLIKFIDQMKEAAGNLRELGHQLNIEIKARCKNHKRIRDILESRKAVFRGKDHQVDTYFKVDAGRLKLREDNNGDKASTKDKLLKQCQHYLDLFEIPKKDLVSGSYSDLLKEK